MAKSRTWGIVALVLACTSIPMLIMPYFGLPLAITAVVFSRKQKKIAQSGISTTGFAVGIVGIVLNSITLLLIGGSLALFAMFA